MNPKRIVIDGKSYNSVDEMPPDVRLQYEAAMRALKDQGIPNAFESNMLADQNRNGIPDIVENTPGQKFVANSMKILLDGKEFNSLDELPPEARAKYEQAMGALDANRNGIPDFVEGMMGVQPNAEQVSPSFTQTPPVSQTPMPVSPTITPDTSNGWMLALLGVVLLGLCLASAAGVWYFFLR